MSYEAKRALQEKFNIGPYEYDDLIKYLAIEIFSAKSRMDDEVAAKYMREQDNIETTVIHGKNYV
jgi:hypothetical protein